MHSVLLAKCSETSFSFFPRANTILYMIRFCVLDKMSREFENGINIIYLFFWRMIRLDWQSASSVARCALIGIESCLLGVDNNSWTGSQPMRNKAKMIAISILEDKWGCWRRNFDPTRTPLLVPNNVSSVLLNNLPSKFISARLLCEKIFLNSKREEQTMNV